MAENVGAIDQGTTSTRFMVFDRSGALTGSAAMEHRQILPRPGWVEHDPKEIWANTSEVIERGLGDAGLTAGDLVAVGIANQRETTVVWDRESGEPVCNAIVWQDTRTAEICEDLAGDHGPDRFRARTGLPLATYFAGPKIRWILDAHHLQSAAERGDVVFGTVDTTSKPMLWRVPW